ncbi:MAG: LLM class flavin-dependent oxidoreductase [Acidimicrobiales bacterium]|nr:LLM class flavin-dependent oxidoreductase [Acidimicrobiales bacterium]
MEFGYFAQCFVPDLGYESDPNWEQTRILQNLELSVLCDQHRFKYVWASEHHFLREYSHMSTPEVFLAAVGARTERVHLGSAIFNITAPVNHPVRSAERAAMLDLLTNGRFELGTGRGSSSTEVMGFGIDGTPRSGTTGVANTESTRALWEEAIRELPRMWADGVYSYDGSSFSVPPREIFPKPVQKPHPPLWVACGSPGTFEKAGKLGIGVLCFTIGAPEQLAPLIEIYKNEIASCTNPVGGFVNDNLMCVTHATCLEDREEAIALNLDAHVRYYQSLVFRWLDTFPVPEGVPEWPDVMPEPTRAQLEEEMDAGVMCIGTPDDCIAAAQKYADAGADQLVISPMTTTLPYDVCARTIELFGEHVIPHFDTDPTFRSDRNRDAAFTSA